MRLSRPDLVRGILWNFLGQGTPLAVAIFAIPPLVHGLGTDRFGLLALVWMFIGYFSLFDLGIGRALTQLVSERLGANDEGYAYRLVWTAIALMMLLGGIGASSVAVMAPVLVRSALLIPPELQSEVLPALYALASAIPAVVMTAGLVGVLAAKQRFDIINKLRLPMGLYTFIAPLLIMQWTPNLFVISLALAVGRLAFLILHILACLSIMPGLRKPQLDASTMRPLLRFGSWMTISNVIGPLMVYMDRFIIGMTISITAVAFYATPYEVVTRLWIVPTAVVTVLFPAFASLYDRDARQVSQLLDRGLRYVMLMMFPVTLVITAFAKEGLTLWLGGDFGASSAGVLRWLSVGVFVNCLCQVVFAFVQGAGRPDLTAKFHLLQLPFYILVLWLLLPSFGIVGAAIAWTARIVLDAVLLLLAASRVVPQVRQVINLFSKHAGAALLILVFTALVGDITFVGGYALGALVIFAIFAWYNLILDDERRWVRDRIRAVSGR